MDQGLVVDELVSLAGLDPAVEDQGLAVGGGLHDLDLLELGLSLHDRPHDGVHVALDRGRRLEEPLVGLWIDQRTATAALLATGALALRNMPRCISTTEVRSAPNCSMRKLAAISGCRTSPHEKMSTAAYRYSGQV